MNKLNNLLFLLLFSFFLFCKEAETPYIPTPDIFTRNFTETIPKKVEIESELHEILNTEVLFCESSFQNKKIEFIGDNDNIFVSNTDQFTSSAYLSVYKQRIKDKPDIFVLKTRCCPMGPCYTSYFFQKQTTGIWKLFDKIPGEVIDYKKTKDHTIIKIEDSMITGLTYAGFWNQGKLEPFLAYRFMNVEIPSKFTLVQRKLTTSKEFNLLKKPKDYHIDNLAFRIKLSEGANIYILSESNNHYFVMIKATTEQINNILENYNGENEKIISQIQGLNGIVKKSKDMEGLLNKIFYNIGWVEKF